MVAAVAMLLFYIQTAITPIWRVPNSFVARLRTLGAHHLIPYLLLIAGAAVLSAYNLTTQQRQRLSVSGKSRLTLQALAVLMLIAYVLALAFPLLIYLSRGSGSNAFTLMANTPNLFFGMRVVFLAGLLALQVYLMVVAFRAKVAFRGLGIVIVVFILSLLSVEIAFRAMAPLGALNPLVPPETQTILGIHRSPDKPFQFPAVWGDIVIFTGFLVSMLLTSRACWAWAQARQLELLPITDPQSLSVLVPVKSQNTVAAILLSAISLLSLCGCIAFSGSIAILAVR